jgi:molybdopterin synthase sulfur carrier subunit
LRDELIARGEPHASVPARGRAVRMALDQVMSGDGAELRDGSEVASFHPSRAAEPGLDFQQALAQPV